VCVRFTFHSGEYILITIMDGSTTVPLACHSTYSVIQVPVF